MQSNNLHLGTFSGKNLVLSAFPFNFFIILNVHFKLHQHLKNTHFNHIGHEQEELTLELEFWCEF